MGDLLDIERSDALLILTEYPSTSGGLHVEFGIALARRIPVYVVGPLLNVFFYSNQVEPLPLDMLEAVYPWQPMKEIS